MMAAMTMAAIPPTTPPAIAPVFEEELLGSEDGLGEDGRVGIAVEAEDDGVAAKNQPESAQSLLVESFE